MKGWVEYIRAHARNGLIWDTGFHFGDWVALDAKEGSYFGATPNDLTATAFYAHSTDLLARAAAVLGRDADAAGVPRPPWGYREGVPREFYTPAGRLAARTQTAHILALAFGLAPEEHAPAPWKRSCPHAGKTAAISPPVSLARRTSAGS